MKQRKKGNRHVRVLPALRMAAAVLLTVYTAAANRETLGKAGENAAIISAVLNMPQPGLEVLRERFRAEIYGGEPGAAGGMPESPAWPPAQIIPDKAEDGPGEQAGGEETAPEETSPPPESAEIKLPKIPEKYTAPLISENFAGYDSPAFVKYGGGYIRNDTDFSNGEVDEILAGDFPIAFEDTREPQVLIVHTHATESYEKYDRDIYDTRNTWRSTDNNINMVAVGEAMREVLERNGVGVVHDTNQHDYPSYNGSYERSAETISAYLDEYPSIKVVLDLHRDAMQREDAIVKPVAAVNGKKAAQVMIIAACDDGGMGIPKWRENLRFAAAFQDYMERGYPQLTKPVFLCYRKYNMDLTTGSLLLEFGSNANTLEEAVYSAQMAGEALSGLIRDHYGGKVK
ncbi:hypothetical protein FACS1894191_3200 [Clostridia bacterium]|nr:hypothetical protein FACS1894191_3200 [Clostridia bacterium]